LQDRRQPVASCSTSSNGPNEQCFLPAGRPGTRDERLWDAIVPELQRLRLLSRLDAVTLEVH